MKPLLLVQVIALMVLSLAHLLFLRFVEPLCERGELVVALTGEVCDAGVFVCGLILIIGNSANDRFRSVQGWHHLHGMLCNTFEYETQVKGAIVALKVLTYCSPIAVYCHTVEQCTMKQCSVL